MAPVGYLPCHMPAPLTQLLDTRYPIVSAPMGAVAGGRLAGAVSRAGALGMIGTGYQDAAWIERINTRLSAAGVGLTLVWVRCDASTMHTYLKRRGAARDTGKLADWNNYVEGIDLEFRPVADHVVVENSASSGLK